MTYYNHKHLRPGVRIPSPGVRAGRWIRSHGKVSARILSLVMACLLLTTIFSGTAMAESYGTGRVATESTMVNMRSSASLSGKILAKIPKNAKLTVLSITGDWYKVDYNGQSGYIFQDYLTVTEGRSVSALRLGSRGDQVREIQKKLITLGYLEGSADGIYGKATENAVRAFQARNGLTSDGIAGRITLSSISSSKSVAAYSTLKKGDKNADVAALQKQLIKLNYLSGSADGVYGQQTQNAVKLYQQTKGLETDGIAGRTTQRTLFQDTKALTTKKTLNASGGLSLGSQGENVKKLQSALIYLGYLNGSADGVFGEKTEAAVRKYQSRNKLAVDGVAGTLTQNAVFAEKNKIVKVIDTAKKYLGLAYKYGGYQPSTGFDCSGLTMYCFKQVGISISHSSSTQGTQGISVPMSQIRPGDIVGFYKPVGHVGLYIGNGEYIHSPQTGDVIKISKLNKRSPSTVRRMIGVLVEP